MAVRKPRKVEEDPKLEAVRFVEVSTTELVELDSSEGEVLGKFVKVSPTVKASERDAFDGDLIKRRLLASGAVAVVLAPVVVPDVKRAVAEKVAKATSATEAVDLWFSEQTGVPPDVLVDAKELVLTAMAEVGL